MQVGIGIGTSFWFDNWLSIGPITDYIYVANIEALGITKISLWPKCVGGTAGESLLASMLKFLSLRKL
jgi:hypothetical protein